MTHILVCIVIRYPNLEGRRNITFCASRSGDLLPRVATLPLGSGALAGNPFGVDRQQIARDLGMVRFGTSGVGLWQGQGC